MSEQRRKLIEVALPLEAINRASVPEKAPRQGHPATLHLWWARRPLAACRAVLFAQLVDDPSSRPDLFPTEAAQTAERQRLFRLIEAVVTPEGAERAAILEALRAEVRKGVEGALPAVFDPFVGGGSIPFEAQRLGLASVASDLNPVAVVITKALVEIPAKFAGRPPVNPQARASAGMRSWGRAQGLAEDVRHYSRWMAQEAQRTVGYLYPKLQVTGELARGRADLQPYVGQDVNVIAWLWARSVRCPNPRCRGEMPLVGSYWLCKKKGKEAWLEPQVDRARKSVRFLPRFGASGPPDTPKVGGKSAAFRCIFCSELAEAKHLEAEGAAGRFGAKLMAIVADGKRGRLYLPATEEQERAARGARPNWRPEVDLPPYSQALPTARYGAKTFADLFTPRQTVTLETLSGLVEDARERAYKDALAAGLPDDGVSLADGGTGAPAYADAVATYLGLVVDRQANRSSSFSFWHAGGEKVEQPFAQQGINKTWDFCEGNPFSGASGSWDKQVEYATKVLEGCPVFPAPARVVQHDAALPMPGLGRVIVCCDPPYYTNIGYADLSDFFYVWLRRALAKVYPSLFRTVLTPKEEEIVAAPHRFDGNKARARQFFVDGLTKSFHNLATVQDERYPLTVFYSFKQSESKGDAGVASTGWEVMLEALLSAGFSVTGTWPMRTENVDALKKDKAALATSVVLSCRLRPQASKPITRKEFVTVLKAELPEALRKLQQANVAPVDLAQAAIGPGMAVFSRHAKVLEADGAPMRVRAALALINQVLDEVLSEQEGEFDAESRWALAWFEQRGTAEGPFGEAETLSRAKNTGMNALVHGGIVNARGGKIRLLRRDELTAEWDPAADDRVTVWRATQQLTRALDTGGEGAAAALLSKLGSLGDVSRDLAYRLYTIAERKGWAADALAYNGLVVAWPEIARLATASAAGPAQGQLL